MTCLILFFNKTKRTCEGRRAMHRCHRAAATPQRDEEGGRGALHGYVMEFGDSRKDNEARVWWSRP